MTGVFTGEQTKQLLQPINPRRVLRANNQSHLSQQDVLAHLIRVFGFGGFDVHIIQGPDLIFESETDGGRWTVCYRAFVRLTIKDEKGMSVAQYEEGSTGTAINQPRREDAHDLAMKSALSLAKKRAAIHLGDQFGLSLYNKGQTAALVVGTKVLPKGYDGGGATADDLQEGVPQQESLGIDETHYGDGVNRETGELTDEQEKHLADSLGAKPITGDYE